ncbi:lipopolysaccharide biosynthesis protein [Aeromonas veronii]|uniref:lipopolysaccharide biosynthesis protein n=1 Tax=Aeromonas veronii TaxID=654 RepID=UPI003D1C51D0
MMLNRLTIIAISASAWKMLGGPLTLIVISKLLNGYELGLYFTFISVAAIQQVFEMGISIALVQKYASRMNNQDYNRVLFKASLLLYSLLALFFVFFASIYGEFIFSIHFKDIKISWYLYVAVIALSLLLNPIYSWVEGQGAIEKTYRVKLLGSLVTYISLWLFVWQGYGIYSLVISQFFGVIIQFVFLHVIRIYNDTNISSSKNEIYNEIKGIYQFQFKLSLVWITGYFYWNSYNLIIFKYISPEVAGTFGLSFAIVNAISILSQTFLLVQRANIVKYVTENRLDIAKSIYRKSNIASCSVFVIASIVLIICKYKLSYIGPLSKILHINELSGLLIIGLLMTLIGNIATYCRTSGTEYLFSLSMSMNVVTPVISFLVVLISMDIGFLIYSVLFLHVIYMIFAIYMFKRFRREYRY